MEQLFSGYDVSSLTILGFLALIAGFIDSVADEKLLRQPISKLLEERIGFIMIVVRLQLTIAARDGRQDRSRRGRAAVFRIACPRCRCGRK